MRQPVQGWVKNWAVQALVVVEHYEFPVGLHVVDDSAVQLQLSHSPGHEFLAKVGKLFFQWLPLRIQANEHVPVPLVRVHFVQRILFAAKAATLLHVRSANQLAVEAVGPSVITTLNSAGE